MYSARNNVYSAREALLWHRATAALVNDLLRVYDRQAEVGGSSNGVEAKIYASPLFPTLSVALLTQANFSTLPLGLLRRYAAKACP